MSMGALLPVSTGMADHHRSVREWLLRLSLSAQSKWVFSKTLNPKANPIWFEYDFDASDQLNVPGDWNTQKESLLLYEGTIWYKKSFEYQKKEGNRVFVYFGAANYIADVYLNGQKLGRHEGGFTPFNFEITKLLKEKDNFLLSKSITNAIAKPSPP